MEHKKEIITLTGEGSQVNEERLLVEEETASRVVAAREAGKTKAGGTREIPGTGRKGNSAEGFHPHTKPDRMDPKRKDTIRGSSLIR